ncbi:unnamed protein product [Symbiodinium necroappetens]|uniref:EF-hand domain-containing protein n=1 Tax=Symbiodinium necroappetens TaxID=1628268 RepID=A0A812MAM0_9DINO|nr:unnamed protein product [Symbiodinium necroappetens]
MLSMFEITLGNWPPVCRLLSEKVSEWFMLLCVLHKLVIGFAVVGVINGVFIQETFKVASSDNQIMMRQKERSSNLHEMKMRQLFLEADNDQDGLVSREEWRALVSHPAVQLWLGSMDLDAADGDGLYDLILDADKDGDLTMDELIRGVARLKGQARSYDLQMLLRQVNFLTDQVDKLNRKFMDKGAGSAALQDFGPATEDVGNEGMSGADLAPHMPSGGEHRCMEYHCRILIMDTHRGVKEEIEHASDSCLVFVDEEMGAGVLAWNYFFETKPVPVILRAIEDAHLGRSAFRDGRALEDGLDALDSGFVNALGEKRHVKVALKDSTFQRFGDLIEDKDLAKQQISEAIAAGKQVECEIYEKGREASRSSAVCTFRAFPAWKCNVAFMQSPYEGRVAESLAVELANSCKGAEHRCFGAVVEFRGAGARVILRSGPGGPDVSQVARHYEGSGSSTRAFFMVDAANVDSMFVKPEIVLRQVTWLQHVSVALEDEHCLQAQPGDKVTVIYRGERKPSTPFDQWSWCYKSDDPKQEGWLPTFAHTLFVATRSEPSGGQGTEKVSEGDLILPLALRGDFLLGTRLSLGPANLSNNWFPFDHELYKPVQPSSAKVIVEEANLFYEPNIRVAGYGCA